MLKTARVKLTIVTLIDFLKGYVDPLCEEQIEEEDVSGFHLFPFYLRLIVI